MRVIIPATAPTGGQGPTCLRCFERAASSRGCVQWRGVRVRVTVSLRNVAAVADADPVCGASYGTIGDDRANRRRTDVVATSASTPSPLPAASANSTPRR